MKQLLRIISVLMILFYEESFSQETADVTFSYDFVLNEDSLSKKPMSSTFTLRPGFLEGKVLDEKFNPVKGMSLTLKNKGKTIEIVTDSSGRFKSEYINGEFLLYSSLIFQSSNYNDFVLRDTIPKNHGIEMTIMLHPNFSEVIFAVTSQRKLTEEEINSIKLCLRNAIRNQVHYCESCCKEYFIIQKHL